MAKNFKKGLSAFLAALMCTSTMSMAVNAAETINGNTWYGDEVSVDVTAGTDGYNYMALFRKPVHGYEFGGHFMGDGEGPQTFVVIDTAAHNGTPWTPSGIYEHGNSNYEVVYCCDVETMIKDGTYYKRVNLEDSGYYTEDEADMIRAIVTNAYPYVSLEDMKDNLAVKGFEYAEDLTRNEIIAAVQTAIWCSANGVDVEDLRYQKSYKVSDNLQWGYPMHDTSNESGLDVAGKREFKTYEEVGTRIDGLVDYLLDLDPVKANEDQIVITNIDVVKSLINETAKSTTPKFDVTMVVELNHAIGDKEDDVINFAVTNGEDVSITRDEEHPNFYTVKLIAEEGAVINVTVDGTQDLAEGVYFYQPKPADVNNDGIATSREVSQNLVGVAMGVTPFHAEAEVVLEREPVSGAVTLKKVDNNNNLLAGAQFELYAVIDGNTDILVGTYDIDENGLFIGNLTPGEYMLKETESPAGYKKLEAPFYFTVDANGNTTLSVEGNEYVTVSDESLDASDSKIFLPLIPEETTTASADKVDGNVIVNREAAATTSEVTTTVNSSTGETKAVAPVYDVIDGVKEDKGGMFDYQFNDGLTSKHSNYEKWTDMPVDADVRYVGTGEHSKYYVYSAYVEYARNEDGSTMTDENGNYIIKELRRYADATSPSLTINGEETTELITKLSLEPQYDNPGGSRPFMFAMMDRKGQPYYGYCCDLDTPTNDGFYYVIANLEDSDYYGSEESEAHIRSIVMNGYWGTTGIPAEDGTYAFGSLELLKQKLIAYLDANPDLNTELTAPVLDRNNKYQPVTDTEGNIVTATKTMKEMVEGLTSGEALLATQAAIWTYANGSYDVLNGKDGSIVLDPDGYKWNHDAMGSAKNAGGYTNGEAMDDFASTAVDFLYTWLINLETTEESTVVINDKNFVKDAALEIGDKIDEDTYSVDVSFELGFVPGESDNLSIELCYGDTTITEALTGETAILPDAETGRYTLAGLHLTEGEVKELTLHIFGEQYLEHGTYVYLAHGGRANSQNFVGVAEGVKNVDVSKSVSFSFDVEETKTVKQIITVKNFPVPPTKITFKSGQASNISFMLIDKETGAVEFLKKIDIGSETSFEIPTADGKISAVFVKQSTSGMFWASEELDDATQSAVIKCLKANNPSYKGHWDEFFFGEGNFTWEFKKNKAVTYKFEGGTAVTGDNKVEEPVVEEPVVEEPAVDEPAVDEPVADTPVIEEPTLNYTVKGAEVAAWEVEDGVTAIYIAANGKVPAVIWTSAAVDKEILKAFAEEFGADDYVAVSEEGKCSIEYQHNKNKTKTVTYTFTAINK